VCSLEIVGSFIDIIDSSHTRPIDGDSYRFRCNAPEEFT
jgi:hypothetical protein